MTHTEAIEILRKYNEWRRYDGPIGQGPEMTDPKILGEAIDIVVSEKDLALTVADIERIHVFLYAVKNNKQGAFTFTRLKDEQYQEVLNRFNKAKEE